MLELYILKNREVIPAADVAEWGVFFALPDRIVAQWDCDGVRVSTVFLGINHGLGGGPPLVFETMIFGGALNDYQERTSTWQEAEAAHEEACALVRQGKTGPPEDDEAESCRVAKRSTP